MSSESIASDPKPCHRCPCLPIQAFLSAAQSTHAPERAACSLERLIVLALSGTSCAHLSNVFMLTAFLHHAVGSCGVSIHAA